MKASSSDDERCYSASQCLQVSNDIYLITNLKPKRSSSNILSFLTSQNTDVKNIGNHQTVTHTSSEEEMTNSVSHSILLPVHLLRDSVWSHRSTGPTFPLEKRLRGWVVYWDIEKSHEFGKNDCVRIFVTDISRILVMINYFVPSDISCDLNWLRFQQEVIFDFVLITGYDSQYDVLQAMRIEHTVVVPQSHVSEAIGGALASAIIHFDKPSQRILMLERSRCLAICRQELFYDFVPDTISVESTTRYIANAATMYSPRNNTIPTVIQPAVIRERPCTEYEKPPIHTVHDSNENFVEPNTYVFDVMDTTSIHRMKVDVELLRYTSLLEDIEEMIKDGSSLLCDIVYSLIYHRHQRHLLEKRIIWIKKVSVKDAVINLLDKR